MTDISIKLTADAQDAVKGVAKFRTEFAEMVRSIEKPIRQIDALQKTTESARAASKEFFAAKRTVDELQSKKLASLSKALILTSLERNELCQLQRAPLTAIN